MNGCWWIGAQRGNDNVIRWLDGTEMSFTDWDGSQPDNYLNQENCIQMYKYFRPGTDVQPYFAWNDNDCSQLCSFVCEKVAEELNPAVGK